MSYPPRRSSDLGSARGTRTQIDVYRPADLRSRPGAATAVWRAGVHCTRTDIAFKRRAVSIGGLPSGTLGLGAMPFADKRLSMASLGVAAPRSGRAVSRPTTTPNREPPPSTTGPPLLPSRSLAWMRRIRLPAESAASPIRWPVVTTGSRGLDGSTPKPIVETGSPERRLPLAWTRLAYHRTSPPAESRVRSRFASEATICATRSGPSAGQMVISEQPLTT
jgi:hypothetical protein